MIGSFIPSTRSFPVTVNWEAPCLLPRPPQRLRDQTTGQVHGIIFMSKHTMIGGGLGLGHLLKMKMRVGPLFWTDLWPIRSGERPSGREGKKAGEGTD